MAVRVQNFSNKNYGQSSVHSMIYFPLNNQAWWNSHEQEKSQPSKNLSLKVGSPPQTCQEENNLSLQPQDQDTSSTQSSDQSHQEGTPFQGADSLDHCISSDPVQHESFRKHVDSQMKAVIFMGNPSFGIDPPQVDINASMAHIPYAFGDAYINGLYTAYGQQALLQPQMIGIAPGRVPLPLNFAEDGPIYVNSKQYHGILRRRQIRAKLEAQNKLVKNRRPYLHKSRHLHALNRVRGTGGRFLSMKKSHQSDNTRPASSHRASGAVDFHQSETGKCEASSASSTIIGVSNGDFIFQQPDHRFANISSHMGGSKGLICDRAVHRAPIVR